MITMLLMCQGNIDQQIDRRIHIAWLRRQWTSKLRTQLEGRARLDGRYLIFPDEVLDNQVHHSITQSLHFFG